MAGPLDDRERAYESKWVHDQELHFEIMAQRNALLARWAADLLHLPHSEIERYVEAVVNAGISEKGKDLVFEKICNDLTVGGVHYRDSDIGLQMKQLYESVEAKVLKDIKNINRSDGPE